jgi:hypothetical protein
VANTLAFIRFGAVGFIGWLDEQLTLAEGAPNQVLGRSFAAL